MPGPREKLRGGSPPYMGAGQVGKAPFVPKGEVDGQAGPKTTKIKLYLSELSAPSGLLPVGIPRIAMALGIETLDFGPGISSRSQPITC